MRVQESQENYYFNTPSEATIPQQQETQEEVFPTSENKEEIHIDTEKVMEMLEDFTGFLDDAYTMFSDSVHKGMDFLYNFIIGDGSSKVEDDPKKFSDDDIEKITDIVDKIPKPLLSFVNISDDDINAVISEMEEKGVEAYIREYGSYYSNMLPDGFIDDVIENLKNGDIDELYDSLIDVLDDQVNLGIISASSLISKDLKAAIKEALEMLSEKV